MRTTRRLLKQARRALAVAFVFSGFTNALLLATPIYTLQVFETVVPLGSIETLVIITAITAAAIAALALIEMVRDFILARASLWVDHRLGQFVLENGLRIAPSSSELRQDLKAVDTVRAFVGSPAVMPFFDGPWVPLFLVALVFMHPMIGAIGVVAVAALFATAVLQAMLTSRLQSESSQARERSSQSWALATANAPLAAALGLAKGVAARWETANRTHIAGSYSIAKRSSFIKAMARSIRIGAQVAVYAIGAWLVINDQVSPGVLVASAILLARALAPIEQLVGAIKPAAAALTAYRRLKMIADAPEPPLVAEAAATHSGNLTLRDVTVHMPGRKLPALRGIDLEIPQGVSVAIVGSNGSGKSTLAGVLAGAIVPAIGRADLDGIAIARWQRATDEPPIGYMADEPMLIEGTVHDNIVRFSGKSLMNAARAAIRAGVHERLQNLPNGYETDVGPAGMALALSERRAVALARAISADPRIVVLDEPEAGLDGTGLRGLVSTIEELKAAGTSFVIATQDPRLVRLADKVVILSGGAISKISSPKDMLSQSAVVAERRSSTATATATEAAANVASGGAA